MLGFCLGFVNESEHRSECNSAPGEGWNEMAPRKSPAEMRLDPGKAVGEYGKAFSVAGTVEPEAMSGSLDMASGFRSAKKS